MAAFSDTTFVADQYLDSRPQYPMALFEYIYQYHQSHQPGGAVDSPPQRSVDSFTGEIRAAQPSTYSDIYGNIRQSTRALDVACGPGEATIPLSRYFDEVVGIDPSETMIQTAKRMHPGSYPKVTFLTGSAEGFVNADLDPSKIAQQQQQQLIQQQIQQQQQQQQQHHHQHQHHQQQHQQQQQQQHQYLQYSQQYPGGQLLQQNQLNPQLTNYGVNQSDLVAMAQISPASSMSEASPSTLSPVPAQINGSASPHQNYQVAPNSVDLITAAEGAHWFNLDKFYLNSWRALKPGGTLAVWGYCNNIYESPGNPYQLEKAAQIQYEVMYSDKYLGRYWQQPGRDILQDLMVGLEPQEVQSQVNGNANYIDPNNTNTSAAIEGQFSHVERHSYVASARYRQTQRPKTSNIQQSNAFVIRKVLHLEDVDAYLRTTSAYYKWKVANPDKSDILTDMMNRIKRITGWEDSTVVTIVFDTFLILATK